MHCVKQFSIINWFMGIKYQPKCFMVDNLIYSYKLLFVLLHQIKCEAHDVSKKSYYLI